MLTSGSDILAVHFIDEATGDNMQLNDIQEPTEDSPHRTGELHWYNRSGHFVDMVRVKVPAKFHEKQEVVLEYADEHRTSIEVGAVVAVATVAVASLVAYRRRRH
jgi:hypothetical protein